MKKSIILILCMIFCAGFVFGHPALKDETLKYRVMFKWGMINKQAGSATILLRDAGDRYYSQLIGRSAPWADKIFTVRDTLSSIMEKHSYRPTFYEKIAHEGPEDKHDIVRFIYRDANEVVGQCTRKVIKKGQLKIDQQHELTAVGTTVDMLSSFYLMRTLPYNEWKPGHRQSVTIFSGKQKETLTFEYRGIEIVQVGEKRYQCFHITFVFTGHGGKKTSDNMDAWITTNSQRIPVQLEGKLPVGKVKCEIIN